MHIYEKFTELVKQNKCDEIIDTLIEFSKSRSLTVEEQGWIYWNLSDNYALLRQVDLQYSIHAQFFEWGKEFLNPDKLHWIVSDGTQALTLSLGNHFNEWFSWYLYACKHSSKITENRVVHFESHRTAIYSLLKLNKLSDIDIPFAHMYNLLLENRDWENITFSEITYYSFMLEKSHKISDYTAFNETLDTIKSIIKSKVANILMSNKRQEEFPIGSWNCLNSSRKSKESMLVLLHNLACSLNRIGKHEESIDIFRLVIREGHKLTPYSLSLFLSSLWTLNKNGEEVRQLYKQLKNEHEDRNELFHQT